MVSDQTLSLSWTKQEARVRREAYQRALYVVLGVEALMGLYALVAPVSFSAQLGVAPPQPPGWVRMWGGLILFAVALHVPEVMDPVRRRWANIIGIAARFLFAILYLFLAGGFLWLALIECVAVILLAAFYYELFIAELMSRP